MKPKIIKKEAFLIAGVPGSGDETAKAWEAFMKINKVSPLKNQVGEEGYEVRMYPAEGPGKIHVGVQVKDASVPAEYKVFFVPAATYAEFEIYPAKGYESSNDVMSKWLEDNASNYREALVDGMHYGIEIYDKRFQGDKNPESVVGFWQPITSVKGKIMPDLTDIVAGAVKEFGDRIEQFAGPEVRKKVVQDGEKIKGITDPVKGALDYKAAVERLEKLVDKSTCDKIMTACGCTCQSIYDQEALKAKELRQTYATEDAFLNDFKVFDNGTRIEYKNDHLIQRFAPSKLFPHLQELRCACMLIGGLPKGVYASPTACECSRAFTEQRWSTILGRPVKVEVITTPIISKTDECVFIIHL